MRTRMWMLAALVAGLLLVGAGVAYASGSGEDSSGQAGGAKLEKAKNIALDHVNGRVTGTEVDDEEGYYEVEVTLPGGGQVDVHLDQAFKVLGGTADRDSKGDQAGPNDR